MLLKPQIFTSLALFKSLFKENLTRYMTTSMLHVESFEYTPFSARQTHLMHLICSYLREQVLTHFKGAIQWLQKYFVSRIAFLWGKNIKHMESLIKAVFGKWKVQGVFRKWKILNTWKAWSRGGLFLRG